MVLCVNAGRYKVDSPAGFLVARVPARVPGGNRPSLGGDPFPPAVFRGWVSSETVSQRLLLKRKTCTGTCQREDKQMVPLGPVPAQVKKPKDLWKQPPLRARVHYWQKKSRAPAAADTLQGTTPSLPCELPIAKRNSMAPVKMQFAGRRSFRCMGWTYLLCPHSGGSPPLRIREGGSPNRTGFHSESAGEAARFRTRPLPR
jgi:hypothetical protein